MIYVFIVFVETNSGLLTHLFMF